jgi:hypothetical protein
MNTNKIFFITLEDDFSLNDDSVRPLQWVFSDQESAEEKFKSLVDVSNETQYITMFFVPSGEEVNKSWLGRRIKACEWTPGEGEKFEKNVHIFPPTIETISLK